MRPLSRTRFADVENGLRPFILFEWERSAMPTAGDDLDDAIQLVLKNTRAILLERPDDYFPMVFRHHADEITIAALVCEDGTQTVEEDDWPEIARSHGESIPANVPLPEVIVMTRLTPQPTDIQQIAIFGATAEGSTATAKLPVERDSSGRLMADAGPVEIEKPGTGVNLASAIFDGMRARPHRASYRSLLTLPLRWLISPGRKKPQ